MKTSTLTNTTGRRGTVVALLVLAAMILLFFADIIFGGKTICMRDTFCEFLPLRLFEVQAWHRGIFPLWNPMNGGGTPFLADPQTSALYPLQLPFAFLSAPSALCVLWVLNIAIAAAGCYALGRTWKLAHAPSLLIAVSFVFSTWMAGCMEFLSWFGTVVWGPLLLVLVTKIILKSTARKEPAPWLFKQNLALVAGLAAVFSVQYTANYPDMFIYTFLLVASYAIGWCIIQRDRKALIVTTASLLVAGMLTAFIVAPQFLLTAEFLPYSERSQAWDPGLKIASLHPVQWLAFVFPYLFGQPGYPDQYWGRSIFEFWAGTCYVGLLPLLLIPFALLAVKKGGDEPGPAIYARRFFACIGVIGLVLAAGQYTPVFTFLHDHVPGYNHFRWPSKLLVFVFYSFCMLGGLGYQSFIGMTGANPRRARVVLVWISSVFALLVLAVWIGSFRGLDFSRALAGTQVKASPAAIAGMQSDIRLAFIFGAATIGLLWARLYLFRFALWVDAALLATLFVNLFVVTHHLQPRLSRDLYTLKLPAEIRALASPGLRVHSGYSSAEQWIYGRRDEDLFRWAFDAGLGDCWLPSGIYKTWNGQIKLLRTNTFLGAMQTSPPEISNRLADLMGIRYAVGGASSEQILWGTSASRDLRVVERPTALPRAYCVSSWDVAPAGDRLLNELASSTWDLRSRALVETQPNEVVPYPSESNSDPGAVSEIRDDWNRLSLKATTPARQMLVLNDTWYPGWKAFVDGREQPIFRVNYLARGVVLEPGTHQVNFVFCPARLRMGVVFSAIGLFAVLAMALVPRVQRRSDLKI